MESVKFNANKNNIDNILNCIGDYCKKIKLEKNRYDRVLKETKDILISLIDHSSKDTEIKISFPENILFGRRVKIEAKGKKYDIIKDVINKSSDYELLQISNNIDESDFGEESRDQIEEIIYNILKKSIKYKYSKQSNVVEIGLQKSEKRETAITLFALVASIIFGIFCNLALPEDINNNIINYALNPLNTIFLNAVKLIVVPVVFFSLSNAIASFTSVSGLGKTGLKILRIYVITSIISILIGFGFGLSYNMVDANLKQTITDAGDQYIQMASQTEVSLWNTIISIVPSNIIEPFLNTNMLAVIFVSILVGIGLRTIKNKDSLLVKCFAEANNLFINITGFIVRFIPIAIFCSVAILIMAFSFDTIISLLGLLGIVILALLAMVIVYGLLLVICTRLNPLPFYRSGLRPWLTAISLCSSAATMPITMKSCDDLGISKKMYSFSIPLGCTINMDGLCILISIVAIFMAKLFGIDLNLNILFTLAVTVLLLSIACPGIPGGVFVMSIIAFSSIGIPSEAVSLILGIGIIMEACATSNNVLGDIVCSLIVAKTDKYFDEKKYLAKR